jgi:hypothetical protein
LLTAQIIGLTFFFVLVPWAVAVPPPTTISNRQQKKQSIYFFLIFYSLDATRNSNFDWLEKKQTVYFTV